MTILVCNNCKKKWYYPIKKCIYCKKDVEEVPYSSSTVKSITKVYASSLEHTQVPYYVLLLEDEQHNFFIYKDFKEHKFGDKIDFTKKKNSNITIGLIGTGGMSTGIARMIIQSGLRLILKSREISSLQKFMKNIETLLLKNMSPEETASLIKNVILTIKYEDLKDADLVIESVVEDKTIKKDIFENIDRVCSHKTIFATNTSSLSVNQIAGYTKRPDRFIGMHFFNPVDKMNLVEVVTGEKTSKETITFVKELIGDFNKTPVIVKDTPGFIVNRLLFAVINESIAMLEEGNTNAKDIDKCMLLGANYPIGPLALADMIGLDVCLKILENLYDSLKDNKYKPHVILSELVKERKLGRKSGIGFHTYK